MDEQLEDMQGFVDLLRMAYQPIQMAESNLLMAPTAQAPPSGFGAIPRQIPKQLTYLPPQVKAGEGQRQHHLQFTLRNFWLGQRYDIRQMRDFKNHSLPLARVKKIMKADEDVRMIAAEAPVLFSRACEMFILDLTLRSWAQTVGTKRKTLQRNDVATAITLTEAFDFLVDMVPKNKAREEGCSAGGATPIENNPRAGKARVRIQEQEQEDKDRDLIANYLNVNLLDQGVAPAGIMIPFDQGGAAGDLD